MANDRIAEAMRELAIASGVTLYGPEYSKRPTGSYEGQPTTQKVAKIVAINAHDEQIILIEDTEFNVLRFLQQAKRLYDIGLEMRFKTQLKF